MIQSYPCAVAPGDSLTITDEEDPSAHELTLRIEDGTTAADVMLDADAVAELIHDLGAWLARAER